MSLEEVGKIKGTFTFVWKIKKFKILSETGNEYITSPRFTSVVLDNSEWELYLHPTFENKISVSLRCMEGAPPTSGEVDLFFKKNDGTQVKRSFTLALVANNYQSLAQNRNQILEESDLFLADDTLTVGCHIKDISGKSQAEQWIAETETSTEKFSITFPFNLSGIKQLITVPVSATYKKYPDFKIFLDSYFRSVESFGIYIEMARSSFRVFAVCQLSLRDAEGNVKYMVEEKRWFDANRDNVKWELENSLSKQDRETFYLNENSVYTFHCALNFTDGTHTSNVERKISSSAACELNQKSPPDCPKPYSFKEKMRNLYTSKRLCDFTIHVDGKEFPVHKTVLGSVSPVFCAMLERDMKEKENSLLVIEDIDADTVLKLIEFAYNESVEDLQWDSAVKLFSAADKYEILELKQLCVVFMIPKITLENVIETLKISDLHQDNNLKTAAKNFIFANSKQLFKFDGWRVFMESNMKIANEIMQEVITKMAEKIF